MRVGGWPGAGRCEGDISRRSDSHLVTTVYVRSNEVRFWLPRDDPRFQIKHGHCDFRNTQTTR